MPQYPLETTVRVSGILDEEVAVTSLAGRLTVHLDPEPGIDRELIVDSLDSLVSLLDATAHAVVTQLRNHPDSRAALSEVARRDLANAVARTRDALCLSSGLDRG